MNPFPATASPLEIVWLIDVLMGLGMAVFMVSFWAEKRRTLRPGENGPRRIALNVHLFRKSYYLCCHMLFVTVGVMLAALPAGTSAPSEGLRHWAGIALILMLLFTALGMQADMVQAYVRYRRIEDAPDVRD